MSTHVETIGSPGRPRHIRYFEFLQVGIIGILLAIQFVGAGERLIFNLATFGPIAAVLLGLTLAVSRGRQSSDCPSNSSSPQPAERSRTALRDQRST